ncbi:ERCC4 domain-containing protein [Janibacter sp. DB-40]|uniref:ERCC4 domain-containing protein n=1 Tax=Janibacter sp. DB-40 TaxID=3028808 RepID=UPI0024067AE6|nr:ERCC4 domain-containing protein [Janibacter sp. DB-40]
MEDLQILVDSHERYPWRFTHQQAVTKRWGLPCGDYAVTDGEQVVAAVERKSLADLSSSLTSGKLTYAVAELSDLPRAAVVVEDRYHRSSRSSTCARPCLTSAHQDMAGTTSVWAKSSPTKSRGSPVVTDRA